MRGLIKELWLWLLLPFAVVFGVMATIYYKTKRSEVSTNNEGGLRGMQ